MCLWIFLQGGKMTIEKAITDDDLIKAKMRRLKTKASKETWKILLEK